MISTRKNENDMAIAIESLVVRLILKAMSALMKSTTRDKAFSMKGREE